MFDAILSARLLKLIELRHLGTSIGPAAAVARCQELPMAQLRPLAAACCTALDLLLPARSGNSCANRALRHLRITLRLGAKRSICVGWDAVQAGLKTGDILPVKGRDTGRLDRVDLVLQGRQVRREIDFCDLRGLRCAYCPKLEFDEIAPYTTRQPSRHASDARPAHWSRLVSQGRLPAIAAHPGGCAG